MAVPLQTNEKVIGLLYIDMPDMTREFSKEDLSLLTVMSNVAAIRIEHARLNEVEQVERMMSKELSQAGEIQRRLLPSAAPKVPGMDLAGYNLPCNTVGGDYFDFFELSGGHRARRAHQVVQLFSFPDVERRQFLFAESRHADVRQLHSPAEIHELDAIARWNFPAADRALRNDAVVKTRD